MIYIHTFQVLSLSKDIVTELLFFLLSNIYVMRKNLHNATTQYTHTQTHVPANFFVRSMRLRVLSTRRERERERERDAVPARAIDRFQFSLVKHGARAAQLTSFRKS